MATNKKKNPRQSIEERRAQGRTFEGLRPVVFKDKKKEANKKEARGKGRPDYDR